MEPVTDVFGTQTSAAAMAFGLRGVVDWSVQQPFLDVFKTARPWQAHTENRWGAYGEDDLADMGILDGNGWITDLPGDVDRIETFILTEMPAEATYTSGLYRLSYDGTGDITVYGASIVSQEDGEIWFDYQPDGENMVTISIRATDPRNTGDYLRDITVVKQEYIPAHDAGQLFNPLWLDVIGDAHALRFMDWQETNDSRLQSWADRPQVGDYTYHRGVPVEVMVALANATGTEPWFNIPWHADEVYIREFATYVRDNLNPDLRAHIELSNEVWNWMFEQARDANEAAQDRFGGEVEAGWMQEYGARSAEMARVLDAVYAGSEDQLVKVIATHTYWPGLETPLLEAPDWQAQNPGLNAAPHLSFDTYAITGYFGNSLGTDAKAGMVLQWIDESAAQARQDALAQGLSGTALQGYFADHRFDLAVEYAVRELRDGSMTGDTEDSLEGLFELFRYHKSVADEYGLDLVMYEGGTHVVGVGDWVNNDLLTEFFTHLNYSDGMGQLYSELLAGWEDAGGTLFNAFVDVSEPNKWGSWGSLRHLLDETTRHDAIDAFIQDHPAPEHMKDGIWSSEPQDFGPAPQPEPDSEPDTDEGITAPPDPVDTDDSPSVPTPSEPTAPRPTPSEVETDVREYVFGNTMFVWAVGNPELSVAYWMDALADASGNTYAAGMQTGMLIRHDDLPAMPHITIDGVTEAWDRDSGQSFSDADFNQITLSPVNFVQDQSPDSPYWIDPSTSPLVSALRIIDWAEARAPGATINLYESWPEMEGFIDSFPPTANEYAAWQNYLTGEWHDWWLDLAEMIQSARPDLDVRLISVGPMIAQMLDDPDLGLQSLGPRDLYVDAEPQGTATLYFLASLIHFTTVYGTAPPEWMDVPQTIHPAVAENFDALSDWLSEQILDGVLPAPIVDAFTQSQDDAPGSMQFGTSEDDQIVSQGGDDTIDGAGGSDTVSLSGAQTSYTLTLSGASVTLEDRREDGDGRDTLRNVEFLDFAEDLPIFGANGMALDMFDGMAQLDPEAMAMLTELYIAYFNRAPDAIGLYFWGDQLAQGTSLERIAVEFFNQPETRALYGDLDDLEAFVTSVYQNVLGRNPDLGGMSYWLDLLQSDSAVTPPTFIQAILAGAKAETGGAADAAYLANKVMLGGHFSVFRGMSDVEAARDVMQGFDGTTAGLEAGIARSDAFYDAALDPDSGDFLIQLVGITDPTFIT